MLVLGSRLSLIFEVRLASCRAGLLGHKTHSRNGLNCISMESKDCETEIEGDTMRHRYCITIRRDQLLLIAVGAGLTFVVVSNFLTTRSKPPVPAINVKPDAHLSLHCSGFNDHPIMSTEPFDVVRLTREAQLAPETASELKNIIQGNQRAGMFAWFDTRLVILQDGRSLLLVDSGGGFYETTTNTTGVLDKPTFARLRALSERVSRSFY